MSRLPRAGDKIRIKRDYPGYTHPNGLRFIKEGDILVVAGVHDPEESEEKQRLFNEFLVKIKCNYVGSTIFGAGWLAFRLASFDLLESSEDDDVNVKCECPDLLNGHHHGCAWLAAKNKVQDKP